MIDKVKQSIYITKELKQNIKQLSIGPTDLSLNAKVVFILEQFFKQKEDKKNLDEYLFDDISKKEYSGDKGDFWIESPNFRGIKKDN